MGLGHVQAVARRRQPDAVGRVQWGGRRTPRCHRAGSSGCPCGRWCAPPDPVIGEPDAAVGVEHQVVGRPRGTPPHSVRTVVTSPVARSARCSDPWPGQAAGGGEPGKVRPRSSCQSEAATVVADVDGAVRANGGAVGASATVGHHLEGTVGPDASGSPWRSRRRAPIRRPSRSGPPGSGASGDNSQVGRLDRAGLVHGGAVCQRSNGGARLPPLGTRPPRRTTPRRLRRRATGHRARRRRDRANDRATSSGGYHPGVALLLSACGGGDDDDTGGGGEAGGDTTTTAAADAAAGATTTVAGGATTTTAAPVDDAVPDPCTLIGTRAGDDAGRRPGAGESSAYDPEQRRICSYARA